MKCRNCYNQLEHLFIDLGSTPPSNSYVDEKDLDLEQVSYPLKIMVCHHCWLVQTVDYVDNKIMFEPNYAYFSSVSKSWLAHASNYCDKITNQLSLDENSYVVEVASNDGYLLKNFLELNIPCLGIEPTKGTADASRELGISYSKLINLLEKKQIKINRKLLADISVNDKKAFQEIINKASG